MGYLALTAQNAGVDAYNVAVGFNAGASITDGINNTIIGGSAGDAITTADSNVAIGKEAMTTNITSGRNVAIGQGSLRDMDNAGNAYNIGIGYVAGQSITSGSGNVIVGGLAGDAITVGSGNIVLGFGALTNETRGRNIAIGYQTLGAQNVGSDAYNIAVGYQAGNDVTTGTQNTIIGGLAGDALTTGDNNIIVGYNAEASAVGANNAALTVDNLFDALSLLKQNSAIGQPNAVLDPRQIWGTFGVHNDLVTAAQFAGAGVQDEGARTGFVSQIAGINMHSSSEFTVTDNDGGSSGTASSVKGGVFVPGALGMGYAGEMLRVEMYREGNYLRDNIIGSGFWGVTGNHRWLGSRSSYKSNYTLVIIGEGVSIPSPTLKG